MRTSDQVRKEWAEKGVTLTAWAALHGYNPNNVRDVLRGKNRANRGEGHEIAVRLGLKRGYIGAQPKVFRGLQEHRAQRD